MTTLIEIRALGMHSGEVIETGPSTRLLTAARHAYTRGFLAAVPTPCTDRRRPLTVAQANDSGIASSQSGTF